MPYLASPSTVASYTVPETPRLPRPFPLSIEAFIDQMLPRIEPAAVSIEPNMLAQQRVPILDGKPMRETHPEI